MSPIHATQVYNRKIDFMMWNFILLIINSTRILQHFVGAVRGLADPLLPPSGAPVKNCPGATERLITSTSPSNSVPNRRISYASATITTFSANTYNENRLQYSTLSLQLSRCIHRNRERLECDAVDKMNTVPAKILIRDTSRIRILHNLRRSRRRFFCGQEAQQYRVLRTDKYRCRNARAFETKRHCLTYLKATFVIAKFKPPTRARGRAAVRRRAGRRTLRFPRSFLEVKMSYSPRLLAVLTVLAPSTVFGVPVVRDDSQTLKSCPNIGPFAGVDVDQVSVPSYAYSRPRDCVAAAVVLRSLGPRGESALTKYGCFKWDF